MKGGPVHVRLPSDCLTDEEKARLSGPCRVYRPGEWEWAANGNATVRSRITLSVRQKGVDVSQGARRLLGHRVKVGYDGARRLVAVAKANDGDACAYSMSAKSHSFGGSKLSKWLVERGLRIGAVYEGRQEGDMLVFPIDGGSKP